MTAEQALQFAINLQNAGKLDEAIALYKSIIAIRPDLADAYNNLGNALSDRGRMDEAIPAYSRAIALRPNYSAAFYNLGNALYRARQPDQAIAALQQAIALQPGFPQAYGSVGNVLRDQGRLDEAIAAYRHAIALDSKRSVSHSNLIFACHFHPSIHAQTIAEECQRWNHQFAEPLKSSIRPHLNDRDPVRRLRIGYVSPDFWQHPVARFLLPLLANHDHQQVEVFAYAQVAVADAMTQRLRTHADTWRDVLALSDAQAADLIRQDRIDILVDLAGHTANNRLLVFAQKPAPVQVTYLGYPDTTGLSTIDYRLTDAYADPPGQSEPFCSEQLVRLDPCAWCFYPPDIPSPIRQHADAITFGCFNSFAKVTQPMLQLWGQILHAVPRARLLMKAAGLNSAAGRQWVQRILGEEGIDPARLELRGYEPTYGQHLALYGQVDIALDTFPYHGTTTTCEAMWMGVPVVSLAGASHVSRVGVSLLSNVGLQELVAGSPEEYVQVSVALAGDSRRLNDLHSNLRRRMQSSPLMDGPAFARRVEAAYRNVWKTWCSQPARE